ncbi:hypothetical protein C4D60_Mb10t21300 [Musa balbisiana]|uniref:Uncharacterized protein n=1 Tax=Musa balbisiana TaxID=52838 RepID=A0A4S8IYU4_MUSBA|nr:hypothetical protein C4D60_Mb10t21300 [Musa balbisiana]
MNPTLEIIENMNKNSLLGIMMQDIPLLPSGSLHGEKVNSWDKMKETLHSIVEEFFGSTHCCLTIMGVIVGATPWLKSLFAGSSAPLRVVEDTVKLLGDGTVPCITLVLGGNLTQGLRRSVVSNAVIVAIVCVRYRVFPVIGITVVRAASGSDWCHMIHCIGMC